MAFGAPAFWWRRCWSVAPRATWPKPKQAIDWLANLPADEGSAMRRDHAAAAARAAGPGPRRRRRLPGLGGSLSRDGGIAWLRRTHRLGRGDDRGWGYPEIGGARMTAGVACGSCGTGLRENAKFCDECGAPSAVSVDAAEYKQVTVLFADVVRSMDIAAAVGCGAVARNHDRAGGAVGGGGAALRRRDRGVHRRRGDGAVRRPSGVGGSRFSGVPGRAGHPGGGRTGWRPRWRAATAWRCSCGWA